MTPGVSWGPVLWDLSLTWRQQIHKPCGFRDFFFMIFFLYKNPSFIGRLSFLYTSWCLGKWIVYLGECSSYTDPFLWAYPLPCPTLDLQELINKVIFSCPIRAPAPAMVTLRTPAGPLILLWDTGLQSKVQSSMSLSCVPASKQTGETRRGHV